MQPTSKQLHSYVGTAFQLANEHEHYVRSRTNRHGRYWGMVFVRPGVEVDTHGEVIETLRRIAIRIGHFGCDGWSLTVSDTFDSRQPPSTPEEFRITNGELSLGNLFSGETNSTLTCRAIYKLRWSTRTGIEVASRRLMAHTNTYEAEGRMNTGLFRTQLEMTPELLLAELDVTTVTHDDVDFMRQELENHAVIQQNS